MAEHCNHHIGCAINNEIRIISYVGVVHVVTAINM